MVRPPSSPDALRAVIAEMQAITFELDAARRRMTQQEWQNLVGKRLYALLDGNRDTPFAGLLKAHHVFGAVLAKWGHTAASDR